MEILFASGIFPPQSGGPATFVPEIATAFTNRGHTVSVVTNGNPAPETDAKFPFDVVRIPLNGWEGVRFYKQIRTLIGEIRRRDPDLLFSNAFDWQSAIATELTGTPFVVKVVGDMAWERATVRYDLHDDIETFNHNRYSPRIEAIRLLRTAQTRLADRVIVPSEYLADLVASWGIPQSRIVTVYNAIDPSIAPKSEDRADFRLITVCRLVDWKGVEGLLDATARLREQFPEAQLDIVGDGPARGQIASYAERTLPSDAYTLHGRLSHESVLELVSRSRVFALNSTYEGLPHVVLEAMACGTPTVVSDAGGNAEVVIDGETGYVVPQGDGEAFADRIARLLSDETRWQSFSNAGRRRLSNVFDHEQTWDQYEDTLRRTVTASGTESERSIARL
ncbi:glycosyltransferase family 4 protein [Halomicroarcula sp. GCM10025709]|uniref:glycosyltransferase family 4 protein n=1 Tax=Haloarcula TaxID=2237 RepID=UPI0024C20E78|nr:glycosyltransferase family 4 protein [Halomicroarcula sp. YJ-61-S]